MISALRSARCRMAWCMVGTAVTHVDMTEPYGATLRARLLVNSAGLHAPKLAAKAPPKLSATAPSVAQSVAKSGSESDWESF